jgi:hypothetical protein
VSSLLTSLLYFSNRCCAKPGIIIPVLLVILAGIAIAIYVIVWSGKGSSSSAVPWCTIYCDSDILRQVQRSKIFPNSSKIFVDLPMVYDPDVVLDNWAKIQTDLGVLEAGMQCNPWHSSFLYHSR